MAQYTQVVAGDMDFTILENLDPRLTDYSVCYAPFLNGARAYFGHYRSAAAAFTRMKLSAGQGFDFRCYLHGPIHDYFVNGDGRPLKR